MFSPARLDPHHEVDRFECGNASLDEWLRDTALSAQNMGTTRTYLWLDDAGEVVAYFSTAPTLVSRETVPKRLGRGGPALIPGILIAKLALAKELHGRGYGGALLSDALEVCLDAVLTAGGRLIVVDAIDEAAATFYEHHGFKRIPEASRLFIKASDAAASCDRDWG